MNGIGRKLAAQHGAGRRGRRHAPTREEIQLHLQAHEGQCRVELLDIHSLCRMAPLYYEFGPCEEKKIGPHWVCSSVFILLYGAVYAL